MCGAGRHPAQRPQPGSHPPPVRTRYNGAGRSPRCQRAGHSASSPARRCSSSISGGGALDAATGLRTDSVDPRPIIMPVLELLSRGPEAAEQVALAAAWHCGTGALERGASAGARRSARILAAGFAQVRWTRSGFIGHLVCGKSPRGCASSLGAPTRHDLALLAAPRGRRPSDPSAYPAAPYARSRSCYRAG